MVSISKLTRFFSQGHERSIRAKKNILFSFLIKGTSIAVSFLLVPLTIHYVNQERYGIWLTLSSIVSWVGFFDIGLGNGLRNKFAEAKAKGDIRLARIYISTTYAILTIIVAAVWLAFVIANPFIDWTKILNTSYELRNELQNLVFIVITFFCLRFIFLLITTVLIADQKTARSSFYNLLGNILALAFIFILTKTTQGNLNNLAIVLGGLPVLVLVVATVYYFNGYYKEYKPRLASVDFSHARELMSLGVKFFVLQIAALIIYQTNNIIIAQLFGPSEVTVYNIAYKYFFSVSMVFGIIITPFWSAFTEANAKNDIIWIRNTIKKLVMIWGLICLLIIAMLTFSKPFYHLWVGDGIQIPFSLSLTMAIYLIVNTWCSIFVYYLNGVGKLKLQLYSGIITAIINIPLSIFLGRLYGIAGVVGASIVLGLIGAVWAPIQYHLLITQKAKGIWNR